jgi:hypothetical protein
MSKARDVADSYTDVEVDAKDATLQTQVNDRYTKAETDAAIAKLLRSDASDTMSGDLTIQNSDPSLILRDTDTIHPSNQAVRLRHNGLDNELPNGEGLGLIIDTPDTTGSDLTPAVITTGEFYAQNNQKVYHTGNEQQIGVGQTWQNVAASRSSGVTYTNTTGKPIVVSVWGNFSNSNWLARITINGVVANYLRDGTNYNGGVMTTAIVPNGQTYRVDISGISGWAELR